MTHPPIYHSSKSKNKKVSTYSDGGARGNPGPAAIGMLVLGEEGQILFEDKDCLGEATNNVAEYRALIGVLKLAKEAGASEVESFLDSEIVARQMTGIYRVREAHLKKLYDEAKKEERNFRRVTYHHLPRTHPRIKHVDRLVNQALDEM